MAKFSAIIRYKFQPNGKASARGENPSKEADDDAAEAKPWLRGGALSSSGGEARGEGTHQRVDNNQHRTVRAVTATTARVTKRARVMRAMTEPSPRDAGDEGPPPVARVQNNQLLRKNQWQGTLWR